MNFALSEIAKAVNGKIIGDSAQIIKGVAPFEAAQEEDITFAANARLLRRLHDTRARAIIVPEQYDPSFAAKGALADKHLVTVKQVKLAFIEVVHLFYPSPLPQSDIHASVVMGKNVVQGTDNTIGPFTRIGDDVLFGRRVRVISHVFIGNRVTIGDDVTLYPNVTLLDGTVIGNRVIIHAGTVIGSDGFGFEPDGTAYRKIPHLGSVRIDDDVEIGAGNTIDRGTFGVTHIKRGVKTDNLVHIAHNVSIGEDTLLVAQTGIAGSTKVGKHVILAGQTGVSGHLTIGDNAIVGPQSGIVKSVSPGEVVSGTPEMPHKKWLRVQRTMTQLPEMAKKISALEKALAQKKLSQDQGDKS